MPQTTEPNTNQQKTSQKKKRRSRARLWVYVSTGVVATGLLVASYFLKDAPERAKFLTDSVLSTLILAVIIVQAAIYRGQWELMRRQWIAMRRGLIQTRKMAIQNERAIKAAEENVKTVERIAIYANRAYLTASHGISSGSAGVQMYLRIENSGNTPANDVGVSYSCGLRDNPPYAKGEEPEEPVAYDIGFTLHEKVGLIPPKGFHLINTPQGKSLTSGEYQQWKLGQIRFYCWGVIIYEDIFNEWRRTQFCFSQWGGNPKGDPCEYGNRAD